MKRKKDGDITQIEDDCLAVLAFIAYRLHKNIPKKRLCDVLGQTTRLDEDTKTQIKRAGWWEFKFSNMHFAFKRSEGMEIQGLVLEQTNTKGAQSAPGVQARLQDYAIKYFFNDFDKCVKLARAALDKDLPIDVEKAIFGDTKGNPSHSYMSSEEIDAVENRSPEGLKKLRKHWYLERDSSLPKEAKRIFLKKHGELFCEICGIRPVVTYGHPLVDAHHKLPLSKYAKNGKINTGPSDFSILCPNCHRAVHKQEDCDIDAVRDALPSGGIIFRKKT